nr:hypothetical protein [Candidatus Freyarchaeota archaeon]
MKLLDTETIVELLRKREHEFGAVSIITLMEVLRVVEIQKRTEVKELLEESFINWWVMLVPRIYGKGVGMNENAAPIIMGLLTGIV